MRPCSRSAAILSMFTALQIEPALRGVKRMVYVASSTRLRTPSIQPWHSAWSTDSDQVMHGVPVPTL